MYESTIQALEALYPKLSVGGYLIVDDYGAIPSCRQAVDDFRSEHGINDELEEIDWTGVFWQRRGTASPSSRPTAAGFTNTKIARISAEFQQPGLGDAQRVVLGRHGLVPAGGGGGVPSPNGRPPSWSRWWGVSQFARSGPTGTMPLGLMSRCTR